MISYLILNAGLWFGMTFIFDEIGLKILFTFFGIISLLAISLISESKH